MLDANWRLLSRVLLLGGDDWTAVSADESSFIPDWPLINKKCLLLGGDWPVPSTSKSPVCADWQSLGDDSCSLPNGDWTCVQGR